VYEAWDPLLDRGVTVKTLQFGLKMSARIAVDRQILRACRAAAELHHRGIAAVLDSGLSAHGVYVATERLAGQDLECALYDGWRPGTPEVLKLGHRLCKALAYAHERGLVHGCVEPANIFVTRIGRPKLLNFGLEDALREAEVADLLCAHLGSLAYRAPEQLAGGPAEPRSDVYALGAVMYELLAGRRAFTDDTPEGLLRAILNGPAAPLSSARPDLPEAVIRLVESALAFEPEARPQSAAAMSAVLREYSKAASTAVARSTPTARAAAPATTRQPWLLRWGLLRKWLGLGSVEALGAASIPARNFGAALTRPQALPVANLPAAETSNA
jgi:serine/threonine-protein kinase